MSDATFETAVCEWGYGDVFTCGEVTIEIGLIPSNRSRYAWQYRLLWRDEVVFEGGDLSTYHCDPLSAIADLAAFLTSEPEESEPTEAQRAWYRSTACESLAYNVAYFMSDDA